MTAIRVARGFTGRPSIVKFAGNYHGHSDALLAEGGSGVATLGPVGLGRRDRGRRERDRRGPLQRGAAARRQRGLRDRGTGGRQHGPGPAGAGLPRGPAGGVRRRRRPPDLRRGDHRLPPRPGRRAGAVRGAPRPHLLRQGHRRRAAHRRLRRPGRRHGAAWPRSGPCTRPARCPGTRWRRRPGWPRWAELDDELYDDAGGPGRAAWAPAWPTRSAPPASRSPCPWWARCVGLHFSATPAVDYDTARTTDTARYAAFFHAMLRRGVALAPGPYEVAFPGLAHDDAVIDAGARRRS